MSVHIEVLRGMRREYVGRTITDVRPIGPLEVKALYWGGRGVDTGAVVFELDDGSLLIPMADQEGNGPGWPMFVPAPAVRNKERRGGA